MTPISSGSNVPALINLGVKIVEISGIKKQVVRWFTGKTILVAGMAGAGKTTFINYFQYGIFSDGGRHKKTVFVEESPTFSVSTGNKGALELNVKTAVEIPGQYSSEQHAMHVYNHKPNCLLVFLDSAKIVESYQWLETFCNTFEDQWLGTRNNTIQSITLDC
jgi:GTPase SAR1 family protein